MKDIESILYDPIVLENLTPLEINIIHDLIAEYIKTEDKAKADTIIRAFILGVIDTAKRHQDISADDYNYILTNYIPSDLAKRCRAVWN